MLYFPEVTLLFATSPGIPASFMIIFIPTVRAFSPSSSLGHYTYRSCRSRMRVLDGFLYGVLKTDTGRSAFC